MITNVIVKCLACQKNYNLSKAAKKAINGIVYCPHCLRSVGKVT